jgi:NADH-quinone oxidoreductase subunit J
MFSIILYTLNFFLIFSTTCIFLVENAVHSVFFLVLTFLNAAAICFLFGADFLGLLIVIIYVGAIAVLFLFVVMMLNAKISGLDITKFLPIIFSILLILFIQIYLFFTDLIINFNFISTNYLFESISKEFFLGECLYNYFLICFLLAGIVLLTGMIGAIVLTLNFDKKKFNQMPFRQLGRTDTFLSFF